MIKMTQYTQAYDIGGTLAASNRDIYVKQMLGEDASFKTDSINYSAVQVEGIKNCKIDVWPLDRVVSRLEREISEGSEIIAITQGTPEMAESFLEGADLLKYISRIYATDKKTTALFLSIFEQIYSQNKIIENYHDDNINNILEARKAADEIMKKYGLRMETHLVGGKNEE